jgi:sirohydrochlorin ferrochelatase
MKTNIGLGSLNFVLVLFALTATSAQDRVAATNQDTANTTTGILLLAHGGKAKWNEEVTKIASTVNAKFPVEVAFGMADKRGIQLAVDSLTARGVREIVAVPLFISSHSSVITSSEFLLGLRPEAPKELTIFAKMDHGGSHGNHHSSAAEKKFDPMTPVSSALPIQMAPALNRHATVADILAERAKAISESSNNEVLVIVAHGPVSDETNRLWLDDMKHLVYRVKGQTRFKRIEYLTVRDDAPEPIRSKATAELRSVVEIAVSEKSRVLIVPLLLSFGGIEDGIKKRLEGLNYVMSDKALLPDERLAEWVIESVKKAQRQ